MEAESTQQLSGGERWPSVGIVILNWENYEDTAECLDSLRSTEYPNFRTVVVDNGSTDGSGKRLAEEYDWCEFVFNDENLGFAAGNNPGIDYMLSDSVDYILLLNDDTIVPSDFLRPLVETAETYDSVVAVGAVQYHAGSETVYNAGNRFIMYAGGRVSPMKDIKQSRVYEVDYALTSSILLDAEFTQRNNILHEGYFIGMDDVDLAIQARREGGRVVVNPESRIEHKVEMTLKKSPFDVYHKARNRLHLAEKRLVGHQRVLFYIGFVLSLVQFSIVWGYHRRVNLIEATALGIYDHLNDNDFRPYESF